jgi:hypothetical protein
MSTTGKRGRTVVLLLLLAVLGLLMPPAALAGGAPPKTPTEVSYVGVTRQDLLGYPDPTSFIVVVRATGVNSTYRVRATVAVDDTVVGSEVHKITSGAGMTEWGTAPFVYTTPAAWGNATVDVGLYAKGADVTKPSKLWQRTFAVSSAQLPAGGAQNLFCASWYPYPYPTCPW